MSNDKIESGELPPKPERDGDWAGDDWYTFDSVQEYARAAIAMHQAAPVKVAGLGRIWNEEDGFLELQFKDEAAAQAFMQQYEPSVDCRDMPDMHRAAAEPVPTDAK